MTYAGLPTILDTYPWLNIPDLVSVVMPFIKMLMMMIIITMLMIRTVMCSAAVVL